MGADFQITALSPETDFQELRYWDVVIVGAGPAGLTAGLTTAHRGLTTLAIEAKDRAGGQPQFLYADKRIVDVPGFPDGVTGEELSARVYRQAVDALVQFRFNEELVDVQDTDEVEKDDPLKRVVTTEGSYLCRKVILSLGLLHFPRKLGVLDALDSKKVFYKVPKIGDYEGQRVAVVGGGDSALDAAVMVLERGGEVDLVVREDTPVGKADTLGRVRQQGGQVHLGTEISAAHFAGDRLRLVLTSGADVDADVVIVQIGFLSAKETFRRLDVRLNADGSMAVDPYLETSRRGVFAVGDVHGDIKLITVAWAEGIQAAIYAFKEITSPYWLNEKRLRDHQGRADRREDRRGCLEQTVVALTPSLNSGRWRRISLQWDRGVMYMRVTSSWVTLGLVLTLPAHASLAQTASTTAAAVSPPRALLDEYCVACHNDRARQAGLTLQTIDADRIGRVDDEVEAWEKVAKKLRARAMPPPGRPRPEDAVYESVASSVETALDSAAAADPNPGRPPIHRLNRVEYRNAVRDLLALDIDERELLPPDESGYGFDNIADVLAISPVLLDHYMVAAEEVSRMALGSQSIRPSIRKYTIPYTKWQDGRMSEDLPFGSRGGLAVRHHFPLDGEYVIKLALQRAYGNHIRGLGVRNDIEVRVDRERVAEFGVGGDGERNPWGGVSSPSLYEQTADEGLEVRLEVKAGTRLVSAAFLDKGAVEEGVLEPRSGVSSLAYSRDRNAAMALDSIHIHGPFNARTPEDTPSRRSVFVCYPTEAAQEEACAEEILSTLARRAFRRPVARDDVAPLVSLYRTGRDEGTFEQGIEFALRGVLIDPEFLFRIVRDPRDVVPPAAYHLSDLELASRLSFFLWSSIPDVELLDVAAAGRLSEPAVLEQQVARMLADARSEALVDNFFGQWLLLRNMREVSPDPDAFPDFDENLREAMERETELFVESQFRDDRSVIDLLRADYTYLNERLARHYGLPNVYGNHFRRVTVGDEERRGLLGQGSILTVTSYPNRTSPTKRGLWVLESLLGSPPPPPPPEVPGLPDANHGDVGRSLSMRERMEVHRTSPVCASCHMQMDPLGFSLENFDGIGAWRTDEDGAPIDAASTLPHGESFEGPTGLRDIVLQQEERFAETVTEKLLTYALGRGVEYYDAPAIRRITRDAASSDYRWSSVIQGIVESTPFQMRSPREP